MGGFKIRVASFSIHENPIQFSICVLEFQWSLMLLLLLFGDEKSPLFIRAYFWFQLMANYGTTDKRMRTRKRTRSEL